MLTSGLSASSGCSGIAMRKLAITPISPVAVTPWVRMSLQNSVRLNVLAHDHRRLVLGADVDARLSGDVEYRKAEVEDAAGLEEASRQRAHELVQLAPWHEHALRWPGRPRRVDHARGVVIRRRARGPGPARRRRRSRRRRRPARRCVRAREVPTGPLRTAAVYRGATTAIRASGVVHGVLEHRASVGGVQRNLDGAQRRHAQPDGERLEAVGQHRHDACRRAPTPAPRRAPAHRRIRLLQLAVGERTAVDVLRGTAGPGSSAARRASRFVRTIPSSRIALSPGREGPRSTARPGWRRARRADPAPARRGCCASPGRCLRRSVCRATRGTPCERRTRRRCRGRPRP